MSRFFVRDSRHGTGVSFLALAGLGVLSAPLSAADVTPVPIALAPLEGLAINLQSITAPLVVERVKSGQPTALTAWQSGELDEAMLLYLLSQPGGDRSHESLLERAGVVTPFVELLVSQRSELVKPQNWEKLSAGVKFRLADFWFKQGDARAKELFGAIVGEQELRIEKGERPDWSYEMSAVRLGEWLRDNGESAQAIKVFESLMAKTSRASFQTDPQIEVARLAKKLGQHEKSGQLYSKVLENRHGWFSALTLYDQASPLIAAGEIAKARVILSQPVTFRAEPTEGTVAINSWLAGLAFQEGDLNAALRLSEQAVKALPGGKPSMHIVGLYAQAQEIYARAGGWKTQPIRAEVTSLSLQTNASSPTYGRFRITTYGDTSVSAKVNSPDIQVRVLPLDNWKGEGLSANEEQSEVIIEVPAKKTGQTKEQKFMLLLQSAARVGKPTLVPIIVQAK